MFDGKGLSQEFIRNLRLIDPDLRACFDESQDAIIIWAERAGRPKTLEFTSRRVFEEPDPNLLGPDGLPTMKKVELRLPELERWTIKRLKDIDVWKKHGTGKAFDDWLYEQENDYKARKRRQYQHERKEYLKEHRREFAEAFENLKRGIIAPGQQRPLTREEVKRILGNNERHKKRIVVPVA